MAESTEKLDGNDSNIEELNYDEFNFGEYLGPITKRLFSVTPPFTLGIFGGWGSGKTSLMSLLRSHIENEKKQAICIWFDAWKFDKEETIWRALIMHTLNEIESAVQSHGENNIDIKHKIDEFLSKQIEPTRQQLFRSFQTSHKGAMKVNWGGLPKILTLALVKSMTSGSTDIINSLFKLITGGTESKDSDADSQSGTAFGKGDGKSIEQLFGLLQRQETKEHFEHIRYLDQFHNKFRELTEAAVKLFDTNRLVFFIDDLDRCLPEHAIEVMEAIKLFLSNKNCVFVVGVDEQVIHAGLDVRYRDLFGQNNSNFSQLSVDSNRRQFHEEYLEKIIQLPFTLPPLPDDEIRRYITSRINMDRDSEKELNENNMLVELMLRGCEYNPRKLKRACYLFNLNWDLAVERKINGELNPEIIMKLVIIQLRARHIYQHILQNRSALLPMLERYWESEHVVQSQSQMQQIKEKKDAEENIGTIKQDKIDKAQKEKSTEPHAWIVDYVKLEWLKTFLLWQPPENADLGSCTRFDGLRNIDAHIQLKATTISKKEEIVERRDIHEIKVEARLLQDLLHEDLAVIESACNKIPDDVRPDYREYLYEYLQKASNPWRQRVSAGDALGFIGDPRFEEKRPSWVEERESALVEIPAGKFYRGSTNESGMGEEEIDGMQYEIQAFQMARYPVTYVEYQLFLQATNHKSPRDWKKNRYPTGLGNHPVVHVNWPDTQVYIKWLNDQSVQNYGHRYSLPTEAQWERAARGLAIIDKKENRQQYPWDDGFSPYKCNVKETGLERTTAVGCFIDGASPDGVLDMSGNVLEWCADWYDSKYYSQGKVEQNKMDADYDAEYKVLRGGSFYGNGKSARCSCRYYNLPDYDFRSIGFRVARIKI